MRREKLVSVAMVTSVLLGTSALGYGVARASEGQGWSPASQSSSTDPSASPSLGSPIAPGAPRTGSTHPRGAAPTATSPATTRAQGSTSATTSAPATPGDTRRPVQGQVSAPLTVVRPRAITEAGPRLLGPDDHGQRVRQLQARLRQVSWYSGEVTDDYDATTTAAVRGFQDKRGIAVTGYVDRRTQDRLAAMTRTPTADELANKPPGSTTTRARLDARCTTGRAMCVDKSSRTVRWVVDGKVRRTMAVRFGASYTPTREGLFRVGLKSRDHVSRLYDSPMPFAMFFSGGQALHYSSDFAARGYSGASHGCVNVRDRAGVEWLFDQVATGDKVVVYWS